MDDEIEIDVKKYIRLLLKHWWQIIGFAVIIAIIGFVVSSQTTTSYQATALVAITQPRYQLNFDPTIQTLNIKPADKAYLDLATSDDVLKQVYEQWTDQPGSKVDLDAFRQDVIKVENGSDLSIVKLTVTTNSPDKSARLANLWASVLINKANAVYFTQAQQEKFLEDQTASAKKDLDTSEQALVDFQAQNQLQILTNQLNSVLQNQSDYLTLQRNLTYLEQNVQGLGAQLNANPGNKLTTADQFSALLLQVRTYNSQMQSGANPFPIQFQVNDPTVLGSLDTQTQVSILDNLAKNIHDSTAQIDNYLKALDPQILKLQQAIKQYQVSQDQLNRAQSLAQDAYTTLAKKMEEVRISAQDPSSIELQLASNAIPPTQGSSGNKRRNTLIAGFAGGILAILAILVLEWWHGTGNSTKE